MYNEQLVSLMDSINQELKLIIEDELFDKLSDAIPAVNVLLDLIAKVDVTLCFSYYLRGLPNGIDICRPTIIQDDLSTFLPCIRIIGGRNPLLVFAR